MRIALTGNPNSGKTTMYNALTGMNEKVGNWAGVTVDKKQHKVKHLFYSGQEEMVIVDLPGAYSMSPFTGEETITSDYVKKEKPDVIVNIVDATNLSRSLFFTTQLLELGIPMVVALNKTDINEKQETMIDASLLAKQLGCPVVETVSVSQEGLKDVVDAAVSVIGKKQEAPFRQNIEKESDRAAAEKADRKRFAFVNRLVEQVETRKVFAAQWNVQDKIDAVITHPVWGLAVFAAVMFMVFHISQAEGPLGIGVWMAGILTGWMEALQQMAAEWISGASPLLQTLVLDGVIGGVMAVLGFLPLVMVMYFLIALLEDCGYMARVSVVLDPIFKKVGLSGRSVIPFVITTGCAVPGVMASRTIRNERERRATAMLAPFMPCGAKLPVIALFAGAFFSDASWVGTAMYFAGILLIFLGALLVNRVTGNSKKKSYFIMELPEYKWPSVKRAFLSMLSRGWAYIVKAGTVILLCNTIVQVMQMFDWHFALVAEGAENTSILATLANPFAYVLVPVVGYHAWQLAAAAITGFIAKENVVGTLAVCFGISNLINTDELALMEGAGTEVAAVFGLTKAAALAYLVFNLFTPPCFAAIGAMNAEMKSRKWLFAGLGLQLGVGFAMAFAVYHVGTLFTEGKVGNGFVPGLMLVGLFVAVIGFLIVRGDRCAEWNGKLKTSAKG